MAQQLSRFVFLGAPGVGKGTFASIIASQLVSEQLLFVEGTKFAQTEPVFALFGLLCRR
jgi:Holliday junction resolvasome RuvABC ATP-dependent DNA helicase subunit